MDRGEEDTYNFFQPVSAEIEDIVRKDLPKPYFHSTDDKRKIQQFFKTEIYSTIPNMKDLEKYHKVLGGLKRKRRDKETKEHNAVVEKHKPKQKADDSKNRKPSINHKLAINTTTSKKRRITEANSALEDAAIAQHDDSINVDGENGGVLIQD